MGHQSFRLYFFSYFKNKNIISSIFNKESTIKAVLVGKSYIVLLNKKTPPFYTMKLHIFCYYILFSNYSFYFHDLFIVQSLQALFCLQIHIIIKHVLDRPQNGGLHFFEISENDVDYSNVS